MLNKVESKFVELVCVECDKAFQVSIHRQHSAKYCSRVCKDRSQLGRKAWNCGLTRAEYRRKEPILSNSCLFCGKPVKSKFCNHSCQTSYRNKKLVGVSYEERYGVEKAKRIRSKMSKSLSRTARETGCTKKAAAAVKKIREGKTIENLYGQERAEQIKDKIRRSLSLFRQTPLGVEQRRKTSERNIKAVLSGRTFANSKKGMYEGVFFGSSLEEGFLKEVFRLLGSLRNVRRNQIIVPKGTLFHRTVPDYCIVNNKGDVIGLVECKWERYMKTNTTFEKALALYLYGERNGIFTGYFTYNTLKAFKKLSGNPEPRRLNFLLALMQQEIDEYVVSRKVQRLGVEDKNTNKTPKIRELANSNPNYPLPLNIMEEEIVRHPLKSGVCA